MLGGNFVDKLRNLLHAGFAPHHALTRPADPEIAAGASHGHVHQATLFGQLKFRIFVFADVVRKKILLQARQINVRKLKALGGVHGHQAHGVGILFGILVIGFKRGLRQESVQRRHGAAGHRLKCRSVFIDAVFFAVAHGGIDEFTEVFKAHIGVLLLLIERFQTRLLRHQRDEFGQTLAFGFGADFFKQRHKCMRSPNFRNRIRFSQNFPNRNSGVASHRRRTFNRRCADPARRLIDDAKKARVVGIGKHAQIGHHVLDFLAIEKAQAAVDAVRNAVGRKHAFEIARQVVVAVQNRKVAVLFAAALLNHNVLYDRSSFLHVGLGAIKTNRFSRPRIRPQVLAHAILVVGDDRIGPIKNVRGRTVVLFELDDLLDLVVLDEVGHIAHLGAAKGVD